MRTLQNLVRSVSRDLYMCKCSISRILPRVAGNRSKRWRLWLGVRQLVEEKLFVLQQKTMMKMALMVQPSDPQLLGIQLAQNQQERMRRIDSSCRIAKEQNSLPLNYDVLTVSELVRLRLERRSYS